MKRKVLAWLLFTQLLHPLQWLLVSQYISINQSSKKFNQGRLAIIYSFSAMTCPVLMLCEICATRDKDKSRSPNFSPSTCFCPFYYAIKSINIFTLFINKLTHIIKHTFYLLYAYMFNYCMIK